MFTPFQSQILGGNYKNYLAVLFNQTVSLFNVLFDKYVLLVITLESVMGFFSFMT